MKPIKLTMTAFGPYKRTETIDFTALNPNNLFVVSGNTGAGKTTIFDGICFALYGSASGTDREDNRMLRSDFAADDTHTSIELEFEINGRHYRILRQLGHVKKGNKSKTGERYEFYEIVDGREVPCVDRQMVSEVNKKVEEIIGLTQDQFKQIVMLPQGEFRKLLTSQTENKEAILRRLFKTESYNEINQLLRDRKNRVDQGFKQAHQTREHFVQSIHTALPGREDSELFQVLEGEYYNINQVVAALETESAYYTQKTATDKQAYQDAYQKHDNKQTELHQAKSLNEQFSDLDKKQAELEKLHNQVPIYKEREQQLEEAERASHLEVYEKQLADWRLDEKQKMEALQQADAMAKSAKEKRSRAEEKFEKEDARKAEREETGCQLDRMQGFLQPVKELDERKNKLDQLAQQGKKAGSDLEKVQTDLQRKIASVEKYDQKIIDMDEAVSGLAEKQQQRSDLREKYRVVDAYLKMDQKNTALKQEAAEQEKIFQSAQKVYTEKENAWLNNQAVVLAGHLHNGEACPVCGSTEHPGKAAAHGEMVTRDELNLLKKDLDEKERQYRETAADLKANGGQLTEIQAELTTHEIQPEHTPARKDEFLEKGKKLTHEVELLEKQRDELKKLKEDLKQAKAAQKQLESQKEQLENNYRELQSNYREDAAVYKEQIRNIPEEVQTLAALEKEINRIKQLKMELEKAWEDAQKELQQAKEAEAKATADLTNAHRQLDETKEKCMKAGQQFTEALTDASFDSEQAYHQAKMPQIERQEWKEAIQRFHENLTAKKQQVDDLSNTLKDKERVDLSNLQTQLQEYKIAYEQAYETWKNSEKYRDQASTIRQNITEAHEQVAEREKELAAITDLYDVLRGQNSRKISFERYLQIEYLERIIDAANSRLKRLSNGQFHLMRSDRQESHGRQSGLALDVYDAYTGQTRDVKTLSGGEKFNASLCLALGMSDVIQSFQGNISIDTMFIDEGFGTLDEESLNKAIDTLIDLQQSGRMIGVISHVQELKTMFPAVLEVKKTKEGHSSANFVVK
ncbi:AAA family ATPase [Virgibacillus siamensis]|uniref:AAA family ATPase n=1 Tax=Virgibacillus siamensis TaxID=480071 RepID=UPI000986B596|nr:SMC family ATPase [Virgibacillus siamensis]